MKQNMTPERAEDLRLAVKSTYREVAEQPSGRFPYPIGRVSAVGLGYEVAWLDALPAPLVDRFVGVGNPFGVRRPREGESILDVGCGVGLDVFVAALLVGNSGRAVGIDLTPQMVELPRRLARIHPSGNVEVLVGSVESLPFGDASFDSVISNGALNLVPDKDRAFEEIHRVLKPGGSFVVADLLASEDIPDAERTRPGAWSA